MYEVYIEDKLVKTYPFRLQAVIYLILKGYCYSSSRYGSFFDNRVKIKRIKNANKTRKQKALSKKLETNKE